MLLSSRLNGVPLFPSSPPSDLASCQAVSSGPVPPLLIQSSCLASPPLYPPPPVQAVELLKVMTCLPDQQLDPWQRRWRAYDNRCGIQLDPLGDMQRDRAVHAWSDAERQLFMEKFLQVRGGGDRAVHARSDAERQLFMEKFLQVCVVGGRG